MTEKARPAWSSQFATDAIRDLEAVGPIAELNREWAWGGSTGKDVRVAIIDTGIEADHPDLEMIVQVFPGVPRSLHQP